MQSEEQPRRKPNTGGTYCFVPGCLNNFYKRPPGTTFHRVPMNENRTRWLTAIHRTEGEGDARCFLRHVCSEHFRVDDFWAGGNKKLLKSHVVPTVNLPESTTDSYEIECSDNNIAPLIPTDTAPVPVTQEIIIVGHDDENVSDYNIAPLIPNDTALVLATQENIVGHDDENVSDYNIAPLIPTDTAPVPVTQENIVGHEDENVLFNRRSVSFSSVSTSSSVRNRKRAIKLDHAYSLSPRHKEKRIKRLSKRVDKYREKLKNAKKTSIRRKVSISHLKEVVNDLQRKNFVSSSALEQIEQCFTGIPQALMKRMIKNNKSKKLTREAYPPELKRFAMTLQFYSDKAYRYVRRVFDLSLPAESTIRAWLSNVDCNPGFSTPSLTAIKIKAEQYAQKHNNKQLMCSLLLDEMSIKKEIMVEPSTLKTRGYVDFGCDVEYEGESELATEALVLMVVGVNENFKMPIAYFFLNKMNGTEKANVVREALKQLHTTGAKILSLTCDGPKVHFSMMKELGCEVRNVNNLKPYFQHPVEGEVMVFLDVCHMLKLMRNNWEKLGQFKDPEGNIIDWTFIRKLHTLQETEGLVLANKLRKRHIEFRKAIMKVNLAAQTLSSSVADALDYLRADLRMEEFKTAMPTIRFIRLIDSLFDLLNSRNPFGRGCKTPLKVANEKYWMPQLENAIHYLKNCTRLDGRLLVETPSQTPFLGFLVSTIAAVELYKKQVKNGDLKYLLTYKFSQDHLELFFCSIRSRNGWVVNPNCIQFIRTYKRLLMHNDLRDSTGNCIAQDQTEILTVTSTKKSIDDSDVYLRRNNCRIAEIEKKIEEIDVPGIPVDSEFAENVVSYIAGFIIRMYRRESSYCNICSAALLETSEDEETTALKFIKRKSRGGLLLPSFDLRQLCLKIEKKIKQVYNVLGKKLPERDICIKILLGDVEKFYTDKYLFRSLEDHIFDQDLYSVPHKHKLITFVIRSYAKIRLNSLAKQMNEMETKDGSSRKVLSRLLIFKHL